MDANLERFIRYAEIDTQSDEASPTSPSAAKELDLSRLLLRELTDLGIKAELDPYGRVYGWLPGEKGLPVIGLNSHVDTASEVTGAHVRPRLIANYDGGPIRLNETLTMDPKDFPSLRQHVGDDLLVTDGNTLLGGDDKAGLAIIMAVLAHYVAHPSEKHHPIAVLFTPDEEIGRGPEHFDAKKFGADFAYTIDGDDPAKIECENFNAAHAVVSIEGVSIHPGEAKGKMINALRLASEFDSLLDANERPEYTEGYDGFNHLTALNGTSEHAEMRYIIRNHDRAKLEKQKNEFLNAKAFLERKYPRAKIEVTLGDDYRNMKEIFAKDPGALDHAKAVYEKLGVLPLFSAIRGGTDGATFSFLGCPTPNLGTGSYHHHGRYEYLSVRDFSKMIEIVTALVKA
jgi:tripeptide aminopeptidase